METPINPPDKGSHGPLVRVKQEESVDRTKMEKCEAPIKGRLENTGEKRWKKSEAESDSSEELPLAKSKKQRDDKGEGDRMLKLDEEDSEISTDE